MFNPFNGLGNSGLSNMEREYLINNPEKESFFILTRMLWVL